MKLGSFDVFLHEMNESSRKKCRSDPQTEILKLTTIKVKKSVTKAKQLL